VLRSLRLALFVGVGVVAVGCADSSSSPGLSRPRARIDDLSTVTTAASGPSAKADTGEGHAAAVIDCLQARGYGVADGASLGEVLRQVAPSDYGACQAAT